MGAVVCTVMVTLLGNLLIKGVDWYEDICRGMLSYTQS